MYKIPQGSWKWKTNIGWEEFRLLSYRAGIQEIFYRVNSFDGKFYIQTDWNHAGYFITSLPKPFPSISHTWMRSKKTDLTIPKIPFWIKYRPCPHRKDSLVEVFLYAKSPALDWKLTFYLKDKIRYFLCNTYLPSTGCLISWPIFAGHYFLKNILWREIQYCLNIIQNINWILKNILFSEYFYQEAVE